MNAPNEEAVKTGSTVFTLSLGEWCVQRGLASPEAIEQCLGIQRRRQRKEGVAPRLGEILVEKGILTAEQVTQALAEQSKEIRQCLRCQIRVNVPLRPDATGYLCTRCGGPLVPPSGTPGLSVVEDEIIVVSRDPVPPEVETAARDPQNRFGKYVLLKQVGQGGVGQVFLAWDTYLGQYVALKRLQAAAGPETAGMLEVRLQSLIQEARSAIRLRHPGIVTLFDVGRINRDYYLSMEYLQGETLEARHRAAQGRRKPSPFYEAPEETLRILAEIARAVHYAHTRPAPIVHCDLKPANILIDSENHPHVLDFGLARNLAAERVGGEVAGTPSYMAPEQASGKSDLIDARTDVYALGAILYEMLTGRPPFVGETLDVLCRTVDEEPSRPESVLRDTTRRLNLREDVWTRALLKVPPLLEEVCMRCLKKNPDERPRTMEEVAELLERAARPGLPSAADDAGPSGPPPAGPSRRRAWLKAALAAAAGLLVVGAGGLYLGLDRGRLDGSSLARRESEIVAHLAAFRPEAARAACKPLLAATAGKPGEERAGHLAEEAEWVGKLKERAEARLASSPVRFAELRLRHRTLRAAEVVGAEGPKLTVLESGSRVAILWSDLESSQVVELVRECLGESAPDVRLALGLYCLRTGRVIEGRQYLLGVRESPWADVATRHLALRDR
jgi:serine/threonine protein kinase